MKKITELAILGIVLMLLLSALCIQTLRAQVAPSVRYLNIESVSAGWYTVTWSVFNVAEWGDYCYMRIWVIRGSEHFLILSWGEGLSDTLYTEPHGQMTNPGFGVMGWSWEPTSFTVSDPTQYHITAEMPFKVEEKTHPIDGTQTYYFYRAHVFSVFPLQTGDLLLFAGDYENKPEYYDGELPYFGPYNTGTYFQTRYEGLPFIPENVVPEVPFGTAMSVASMVVAFVFMLGIVRIKKKFST